MKAIQLSLFLLISYCARSQSFVVASRHFSDIGLIKQELIHCLGKDTVVIRNHKLLSLDTINYSGCFFPDAGIPDKRDVKVLLSICLLNQHNDTLFSVVKAITDTVFQSIPFFPDSTQKRLIVGVESLTKKKSGRRYKSRKEKITDLKILAFYNPRWLEIYSLSCGDYITTPPVRVNAIEKTPYDINRLIITTRPGIN